LFFGIQQIAEGFVWLQLQGYLPGSLLGNMGMMTFLAFAWVIWPIYIPLSIYWAETVNWKKFVIVLSFLIGLVIAISDVNFLLQNSITPKIVGSSILYAPQDNDTRDHIIYGLATIPPLLFSSVPNMWIFGISILVTFVVSHVIWLITFTSVWCFFAAASSWVLLKIFQKHKY
jgi:hypothetical protein